jgi:hypothetical protein
MDQPPHCWQIDVVGREFAANEFRNFPSSIFVPPLFAPHSREVGVAQVFALKNRLCKCEDKFFHLASP